MALVGSVVGSFDPSDSSVTLKRVDLFDGVTPTAAIVTVVQEMQGTSSYNGKLTGIGWGVGAITSADQWACGVSLEDASANQVANRRQQNAVTVIIPSYGTGAGEYSAQMSGALVADGITLTKSGTWINEGGSGDLFIEVTLLGGDDFSAFIPSGSLVTSQTRVGGIPFRPNMGFFAGVGSATASSSVSMSIMSQGWVFDNGVDTHNECARISTSLDSSATGDSRVEMLSANFYSTMTGVGALKDTISHTDFDVDGGNFEHNYTTADPIDFTFLPLYMRFDNEDCSVGEITLPSSTGAFSSTGYGHDPAVAKVMGNSAIVAYDTNYSGTASGNNFHWTIEGSGSTVSTWNDEARATIDCHARLDLGTCVSYDDPDTGGFRSTEVARIADGFSMEMTQIAVSGKPAFVVTMGTPSTGLNINLGSTQIATAYLGSTEVSSAYLGSTSLGGAGGWRTFYSDPSPAQNESDWRAGTSGTLSQVAGGILWTCTIAGIVGTSFEFTTVEGKDYRLTVTTGAGSVSTNSVVQDATGTAVNLADTVLMGAGGGSATITFKAIGASTTLSLVIFGAVSDTILIDSLLIEEMD